MEQNDLDIIVTLGNDINNKYAWAITKINNMPSICLFNKNVDGRCNFDENVFVTSISLETVVKNTNKYVKISNINNETY